jgi:hypothetical protein
LGAAGFDITIYINDQIFGRRSPRISPNLMNGPPESRIGWIHVGYESKSCGIDKRAFACNQSTFSRICAPSCGISAISGSNCSTLSGLGSDLGVVKTFPDVSQLYKEEGKLAAANGHQKQGNTGQSPSGHGEPPFIRRMFICAVLFSVDLLLCLWGGENLYRKRYLIGAALIGIGGLLACVGLGLLWATKFPGTWDWWL